MTVVSIDSNKPHTSGKAICTECRHKWHAVMISEKDSELLECPSCERFFGVFRGPKVPDTYWKCNCGSSLYYLQPDGPQCRGCDAMVTYDS